MNDIQADDLTAAFIFRWEKYVCKDYQVLSLVELDKLTKEY